MNLRQMTLNQLRTHRDTCQEQLHILAPTIKELRDKLSAYQTAYTDIWKQYKSAALLIAEMEKSIIHLKPYRGRKVKPTDVSDPDEFVSIFKNLSPEKQLEILEELSKA